MHKFPLTLAIFFLTPFLWTACWEGCTLTYVSFLFGTGPQMEGEIVFFLGLLSIVNWVQIILKLLIIYLSVRFLQKLTHRWSIIAGYVILISALFLIPHLIYVNYTDEGIRLNLARKVDKAFEINKDFDTINKNLIKYKLEPLSDSDLQEDVFRDTSVWYTKPGFIYRIDYYFKFSKCYMTTSYSVACFDQNNILVYKTVANLEEPSTMMTSLAESKDYPKKLTEQLKKCDTVFTNETCTLDPQTYTPSDGCIMRHSAQRTPFLSLFCPSSSVESEAVSVDVFSPQGQLLCSSKDIDDNVFNLESCPLEDKKTYYVIIELNNGKKAIEVLETITDTHSYPPALE